MLLTVHDDQTAFTVFGADGGLDPHELRRWVARPTSSSAR